MSISISSPATRILFIQAAKEGQLEKLKEFVDNGVPIDTTDSFYLFFCFTMWCFFVYFLKMFN